MISSVDLGARELLANARDMEVSLIGCYLIDDISMNALNLIH
jgi:hypothetical protein